METTGLCDIGLSPTLMDGQDKDSYQESLILEADTVNNCLGPCDGKDEEGMVVVEDVEVAEVAETIILGVSSDGDVLINAPLQVTYGSKTSSTGGEMNFIV